MAEVKDSRREQVKELIEKGTYTKAEIAAELGINPGSVSSQMTYLRWMGNFILTDPETKKLSFCSEEDYKEYTTKVAAARQAKAGSAAKSPQERANALAGTIKRQETQLKNANDKVAKIQKDLADEPDDVELQELLEEAQANMVIVRNKLKRNKALAESLPEPTETAETVDEPEDDVEPEAEESDDLV